MSQQIVTYNANQIVEYDVTEQQIAAKKAAYAAIVFDNPKGYEEGRLAIADCRSTRVGVEKRRKEMKASALEWERKVDAAAKTLTAMIEDIETPLQVRKDAVDAVKAEAKRQREEAARLELEAQIKADREALEAQMAAARKVEEDRLAAIAEEQKLESDRLAAERAAIDAARKVEEDRVAAERAKLEADRVAEENRRRVAREQEEARAAAVKAEEEARAAAALAEIEAARRAEEQRVAAERAKLEQERAETARLESERLARIVAEAAAESARVATAERQRLIAERADALRPDGDKLRAYAAAVRKCKCPGLDSREAIEAFKAAQGRIVAALSDLEGFGVCAEAAE